MSVLEKSIWEKIRAGDLKSFEMLFDCYFKGLRTYAQDLLKNSQDAEEIVQDVFYVLWDKRNSILIHSSLKAYLFRSVHNHCINFIQHRQISERKSTEFFQNQVEQTQRSSLVKEEYALDQIMAADLEQEIEEAIKSLPHQCREVFYLCRYNNLKIREIAEKLELSESTVKTQLYRALDKLRVMLKEHLN